MAELCVFQTLALAGPKKSAAITACPSRVIHSVEDEVYCTHAGKKGSSCPSTPVRAAQRVDNREEIRASHDLRLTTAGRSTGIFTE